MSTTPFTRIAGTLLVLFSVAACETETGSGTTTNDVADGSASDGSGSADGSGAADGGGFSDGSSSSDSGSDGSSSSDSGGDGSSSSDSGGDVSSTSDGDSSSDATDAVGTDAVPGCSKTDPPDEVCDGVDNDCDGITDDDAEASGGKSVCDDGNVCNGAEKCVAGTCKLAAIVPMCAGDTPCSKGGCDPKKGCIQTPIDGACEDGNVCTIGDACVGGDCKAGATAKTCNDGDPCTKDVCDKKLGCTSAGTTCDDGNPCTLDTCDSKTAACSNTPKAGCTPCSADSECDDTNACTADSCHAGACLNKAISGCSGPTDYVPTTLTLSKTKIFPGVPGNLYLDLTVENKGAAYVGAAAGKLAYVFKAAEQPVYNSKDPTLGQGQWPGPVLGVPKTGTGDLVATAELAYTVKDPNSPAMTAKFLCLYLFSGGDTNVANNTLCVPNPMPSPQYALNVFAATPAKGTVFAPKSGANLSMVISNDGAGELNTEVTLYASEDATWDGNDPQISSLFIGKVPTGGADHSVVMSAGFTNPVMQSSHNYLCAVVGAKTLAKDPNKDDNAKCVGAVFSNPPDLGAGATTLWTADAAGKVVNFPQWGDSFGCRLDLANYATGDAAPTKVRCFIAPDGTAAAQPTDGWWDVHWDVPAVKGEETLTGLYSSKQVAMDKPMPYGKVRLCAMINWPKNQDEIAFSNNQICRPYSIVSIDLFPRPDATHLYVNSTKDPKLTTMKIGTAYKVNYQIGNKGNIGSTSKTTINQMASRIVLSKDQQYDPSDITIFESKGGYSQIPPHGKTAPWYGTVMWAGNDTATIPGGTAPGGYMVLFVADATNVFKEPKDNNVHVYGAVTVE